MAQQPPALVKHPVQSLQQPTLAPNATSISGAPQFTPRREFIRDTNRVASSFSLLALSGSSFVRLYSFSDTTVSSLRRLFTQKRLVVSVRQHTPKNFYEFTLEGKPWNNAKSITSEKLIIDILSVIFYSGYFYLSTIDYGREQDDKLAIAFSKPKLYPNSSTALPVANGSAISLNQPVNKIPFAISFSSATLLRVVGPPLHSTPAILQAVRGAWPRGVVTEKKVGDATYEFKLKGYKWFQEDTFAADSLHHILGLLTSLDGHGFSLLTSLSLSSRSRVKDLWIFIGDFHPESQPSTPSGSRTDLRREITPQRDANIIPGPSPLSYGSERRRTSRQLPLAPGNGSPEFAASSTSSPLKPHTSPFSKVQNALRKPSPKAGIPAALLDDRLGPPVLGAPPANAPALQASNSKGSGFRAAWSPGRIMRSISNPSSVGSVDMTGIGARRLRKSVDVQRSPDVFYATDGRQKAPNGHNPYFPAMDSPRSADPRGHDRSRSHDSKDDSGHSSRPSYLLRSSTLPIASRFSTTSLTPGIQVQAPSPIAASGSKGSQLSRLFNNGDPALLSARPRDEKSTRDPQIESSRTPTPPLLTPGTFRDSAFSSATGFRSQEIPITWTGRLPEAEQARLRHDDHSGSDARPELHSGAARMDAMESRSVGQQPQTGGWLREERNDVGYKVVPPTIREHPTLEADDHMNKTRTGEVRAMSPEVIDPRSHHPRKSSPPGSQPRAEREKTSPPPKPAATRRDTAMSGWVMVNVAPDDKKKSSRRSHSPPQRPGVRQRRSNSDSRILEPKSRSPVGNAPAPATMSAAAKTIAIIDAVEAKEQAKSPQPSGLRRMFHRSRGADGDDPKSGDRRNRTPEDGISRRRSLDGEEREERQGARDQMKTRGVPVATRPSNKRLSID